MSMLLKSRIRLIRPRMLRRRPCVTFVNPDKYQILHCGIDDTWDTDDFDAFEKMSADNGVDRTMPSNFLLFPTGPFVGEIADTIVNFTTETKIEDAQK